MTTSRVCPQCGTEYPANARFCETDGTALRNITPAADLVGAIIADRYCVLRKLGEGGMGQVYLAEHVKMGRKSALKVLHPGMVSDVDAISRFNREAANASHINHPNVAAVYDFGETADGLIYLAMEFVDGPSLAKLIAEHGAVPPARTAEIIRQAADALAAAHDMGIVHRDLKPDNVMLARTRDGGDLVKVVDFGIAKAAGNTAQNVTRSGLVIGTPAYMSPEQLAGDTLDGRSDVYSLALVAFNMLTGALPFPADSAQESMIMRLTDRPKTLADMRPDIPWSADVQAVMDRGLQRRAADRYGSATEFADALSTAVAAMPETQAQAARTVVVGPSRVPTTRIAAEPPAGATVARRSMGGPVIAAVAVVVIVGAVTAVTVPKFVHDRFAARAIDPPSATTEHQSADTAKRPAGAEGTPAERAGLPSDTSARFDAPRPVVTSTRTSIDFAALERQANDSSEARQSLDELRIDAPRIVTPNDSAHTAIVMYYARLSLNDQRGACKALRDVRTSAVAAQLRHRITQFLEACQY